MGVVAGGFGEVLQLPWQAGSGGGMRCRADRAVRGGRLGELARAGCGLRRRVVRRGGADVGALRFLRFGSMEFQ